MILLIPSFILPSSPWQWAQWYWHTEAWPHPWSPLTRRLLILRRSNMLLTMNNWIWVLLNWLNDSCLWLLILLNFWIMMTDMLTMKNTWFFLISAPSTRRCENSFDASWCLTESLTKMFLMINVDREHEDWQRRRRDRWSGCRGWLRVGWTLNWLNWLCWQKNWFWPLWMNLEDIEARKTLTKNWCRNISCENIWRIEVISDLLELEYAFLDLILDPKIFELDVLGSPWNSQSWGHWLSCWWIRLNNNADRRWKNRWTEFLNEVLDRKWFHCCLSHCIELAFRWWMSDWSLSSTCWLKIDIEYWNQWTTCWLPWLLTTCPVWIWIADNLNRKLALLIPDWKLRLHDEDKVSSLIDILEQVNKILDVLILGLMSDLESSLTGYLRSSLSWAIQRSFPTLTCIFDEWLYHIEPFDLLEELEAWDLLLWPCPWLQRSWAIRQWTSERIPWWCCHSWVSWLFYPRTPPDSLKWGNWRAWGWTLLESSWWNPWPFEHSLKWRGHRRKPWPPIEHDHSDLSWGMRMNLTSSESYPFLTMICEKWACHDFGASLRPYNWRLRRQTVGSEYWSSRGAWTKIGDFEGSTGVLRNADAMSDTATSQEWIWLMSKMSLRVVAWGVDAYLSSLEMICLNPFAQNRPLSSLPGQGPMTHLDSMMDRRSSLTELTERNLIISIMTMSATSACSFVIASLIWSAEYPWRSPWYHSWRMRPWSNSSSDWASWWSALTWSWPTERWFSLMSWSTAAISEDFWGLDFVLIPSSDLNWLLRLSLRCLLRSLRLTRTWLLRLLNLLRRYLKIWGLRNDCWLWWGRCWCC